MGSSIPRKIHRARSGIQVILKAAKEYAYGIKTQSGKGEIFEIPVGLIVDVVTYEGFVSMKGEEENLSCSPA